MLATLKKCLVALALAASSGASAATFVLPSSPTGPLIGFGDVGYTLQTVSQPAGSAFSYDYYFQLPSPVTPFVELTLSDMVNILPTFNITVFDGDNLQAGAVGIGTINVPNGQTTATQLFSNVAGGPYMINVSGNVGASSVAGTQFSLSITPAIPEPHEWGMMLAGLGMIGVIASRRRRADAAL